MIEELKEKLKKAVESRGWEVVNEYRTEEGVGIDFRDKESFERLKKEMDELSAAYLTTSSCSISKDGRIECRIICPIRSMIEFFISCDSESFRPHFLPKEKTASIEVRTNDIGKIIEILDEFLLSKGVE